MSDAPRDPEHDPATPAAPTPQPATDGPELSEEELGKASGGIIAVSSVIKPKTDPTAP